MKIKTLLMIPLFTLLIFGSHVHAVDEVEITSFIIGPYAVGSAVESAESVEKGEMFSVNWTVKNNSESDIDSLHCNVLSAVNSRVLEEVAFPMDNIAVLTKTAEGRSRLVHTDRESGGISQGASTIETFDFGEEIQLFKGLSYSFSGEMTTNDNLENGDEIAIIVTCQENVGDLFIQSERLYVDIGEGETPIPEGTFPDIAGTTFETYITNLSDAGIVGGYKDGTYKPDNDVNRGQLAKFVKLAFNIETDTSCGAFSDVQAGHTFYEHVTTLKCAGIIGGYKDGTYKPDNGVTRAQVTKFIANAMDDKGIIVDMTVEPSFSDVASSNGFYPYIGFLSSVEVSGTKVIKGYPDGTYKPDVILTRGQMSKIVDIARQAD